MAEDEHFPLPGTLRRYIAERREGATPYHLRALSAPDQAALFAHYRAAEEPKRLPPDPFAAAKWDARMADARRRWGHEA